MSRTPAVFPALVILSLALLFNFQSSEAACFLERGVTSPGETDAYTCLRSKDFRKDLERLPLNNTKFVNISFRDSKISKIEKDDFQKFGDKALGISIVHCALEDIEEESFQGLTELKALILRRNKISNVRLGWFKDLAKLESLDLSGNKITRFDPTIFQKTPMMQEFEISENQLTRFDIDTMTVKWPKLKKVGLQWNPYEWLEGVKIIDYSNKHPGVVKNTYVSIDGIRDTAKLIKECQAMATSKNDNKEIDNCMQAKLTKAIEFPKLLEGEKPLELNKTT